MSGARPWTPQRLALLRAGFPTRPDVDRLLAEINAQPGPPVSRHAMSAKAHILGLKRDPAVRAEILRVSGAKANALRIEIGGAHIKRTAARIALIRAEWPTCRDRAALLERVNALPGDPIASVKALQRAARALGLRMDEATALIAMSEGGRRARAQAVPRVRRAEPPVPRVRRVAQRRAAAASVTMPAHAVAAPEPVQTLADQAAIADAAMERRIERAREMLRRKRDAGMIAANTRLPLREVFRLAGEMRRG